MSRGVAMASLSFGEVQEILAHAERGAKSSDLAFEYGVSRQQINRIKKGHRWGNRTGRGKDSRVANNKTTCLTPEDVLDIFNRQEPNALLAREYGVSPTSVSNIKLGYSWNDITGLPPIRKYEKAAA